MELLQFAKSRRGGELIGIVVWAIGISLYELLTGLSPFVADTMPALVLRIASAVPRSMRAPR